MLNFVQTTWPLVHGSSVCGEYAIYAEADDEEKAKKPWCATCKHFGVIEGRADDGFCQRYPPMIPVYRER